ncbi:MAG: hypothetical protein FJZ01_20750 [Candidatus Sericytochromatia bacterium]|nr:hypothetical protein [Candidatus Tanganyikabacteria bacterium]
MAIANGVAPAREHFAVHKLKRPNIRGRDIAYDIETIPGDKNLTAGGGAPAAGRPSGMGLEGGYSVPGGSPQDPPGNGDPQAGGDAKRTTLTARRLKDRLADGGVFKVRGLRFEQIDNPDGTKSIHMNARRVKYRKGGQTFKARGLDDTFKVAADGTVIPGQADARRIKGSMGLAQFEKDLPGVIQTVLKDLKGAA